MKYFLGIDWGGTYVKIGLIDQRGRIKKKKRIPSSSFSTPVEFLKSVKELLKEYKKYRIAAIGVGVPGIIDVKKGSIYYLPNIKGWKNYPLKEKLQKATGIAVFIDNDANVFTLAEFFSGAAKKTTCAVFLTLGTGLGGGLIVRGEIFRSRTSAAELAHLPVAKRGTACGCGNRGCIETFLGNRYLERRYQRLKKIKKAPSAKEIFKRAKKGEKQALMVVREFSHYLGRFLVGLINIFNPEKIIIGGGMSGSLSFFKPFLEKVIKKQAMWPHVKGLKIVRAQLKDDAGIIGAALLAREGVMHR